MIKRRASTNCIVCRTDIDRLMCYYDKQFVELAFKIILDREPDSHGLNHYLQRLRDGDSRREIAFQIASSSEAKARGVTIDAFGSYSFLRIISRIPVIGSIYLLILMIIRIRIFVRELRRVQNAVSGILQELK